MAGRPRVRAEPLDEGVIVETALTLARRGMSALTMRSLSNELQVSVGALYKHVAGRDELMALVVEKVLDQVPRVTTGAGDGWLALRAHVLAMQAQMDRYPGLDGIVMEHSPKSPTANALRREGMAALQGEGLTSGQAHHVYRAVSWLWLGSRVALEGRPRRRADIDTFAESLDILISGLRAHMVTETVRAQEEI